MEFACCEDCNVGTKGADIAASSMAMISPRYVGDDWRIANMTRLLPALDKFAPGLRSEMSNSPRTKEWLWTPKGLVAPHMRISADGPILKAYLSVYAAKFAMALYREHVGTALPLTGAAYTTHFLNAGLSRTQLDSMLEIMPIFGHLKQGAKSSDGQFGYRFNCDDRTIVAALASFHGNLHVLALATSDPSTYEKVFAWPDIIRTRPGELLARLATVAPQGQRSQRYGL